MKGLKRCFWVLLCFCFISSVWAQTKREMTHSGRHLALRQRMAKLLSKARTSGQPGSYLVSEITSDKSKTWDLGVYPGGTWAGLQAINDFGVAVGWGDVPIEGGTETRMIGIPLFGFKAGHRREMYNIVKV